MGNYPQKIPKAFKRWDILMLPLIGGTPATVTGYHVNQQLLQLPTWPGKGWQGGKSTRGKWTSLWWDACAICSYICLTWVTNWQRSKPWQVDNHLNKSKLETVESLSSLVCYYNQPFHAISSTVCLGPPVFPIEHLKHHSQGHQRRSGVYGKLR